MYKKSLKKSLKTDNVMLEFRVNQFLTLKLIDFGDNRGSTLVFVDGRRFNVFVFSLEEAHELFQRKKSYCCMDEVRRNLIWNGNKEFPKGDSEMMFWLYCYYIRAWIDHDYDTRLLQMEEAFPILNALYEAGDIKAKRFLKVEVVKRFLSGYIPVIIYLISMGYLRFFTFEEIILLFEECLKHTGFRHFDALKTQIFWYLRDSGLNYYFRNKLDLSIKFLHKALKLCPTDIQTLKQLGVVYLKKGSYETARAYLEHVSTIPYSKNDVFLKHYVMEAWENLGELYNKLFLFDETIVSCKKAMDMFPNEINSWDQIAIAYEALGDFDKSKNAKRKFKKIEKKLKKNLREAQW